MTNINEVKKRAAILYNNLKKTIQDHNSREVFSEFLCKNNYVLLNYPEYFIITKNAEDNYIYCAPELLKSYVKVVCFYVALKNLENTSLPTIKEEDE